MQCPLCHFDVKRIKRINSCVCFHCEECSYRFCLKGRDNNTKCNECKSKDIIFKEVVVDG